MPTNKQRILVTIEPKWADKMDTLKRTVFYNEPKAALIRYIMERGLQAIEAESAKHGK